MPFLMSLFGKPLENGIADGSDLVISMINDLLGWIPIAKVDTNNK